MLVCASIKGNARAASQSGQVSACRRESFADYGGEMFAARACVVSYVEGSGALPVAVAVHFESEIATGVIAIVGEDIEHAALECFGHLAHIACSR